ncbi:MAG: hypothetical protein GEU76_03925 [Alphaproteobacteria bacterium]|nr:hypothetical protein [Alphaproteobacteria bacterium]
MTHAIEAIDSEVHIRPATDADLPRIMALGRQFYEASNTPEFPWDDATCIELLRHMRIAGILIVSEHDGEVSGVIGGLLTPFPYDKNTIVASEMFWWVTPAARRVGFPLLEAFEDEAKLRGARLGAMSLVQDMRGDLLTKLYQRRGYRLYERSFLKVL